MSSTADDRDHVHGKQPIHRAGAEPDEASAAMILVHGRGATARSILSLGEQLDRPQLAMFAPQATNNTWYPRSFLSPLEQNQPHLDSALRRLDETVDEVLSEGIDAERLILLGFSQGACLTSEYVARNPRRYGGVVALTGGVIGPDDTPRDYTGSLDGTPVFLGSSDPDPHVPVQRVELTARIFEEMDADVTTEFYPGMAHTVCPDELDHTRRIVDGVIDGS